MSYIHIYSNPYIQIQFHFNIYIYIHYIIHKFPYSTYYLQFMYFRIPYIFLVQRQRGTFEFN